MASSELRYGRLVLLGAVVAFLAGAAVQAVRTVPDPDLFSASTGTIISITVTAVAIVPLIHRPPSWLIRRKPTGDAH